MRRAWFEGAMTLVLGFVEFNMALSYLSGLVSSQKFGSHQQVDCN